MWFSSSYNRYPWGWSWAGNTPFRRWKKEVYRGGSTDPFIVSWPAGIEARGEVRTQGRKLGDDIPPETLDDLDASGWELFHIAEDPSEARDVAAEHPEKVREMIARWYVEAGKHRVLPIDGSLFLRLVA